MSDLSTNRNLRVQRKGHVLSVTLTRPQRLNALNDELTASLTRAISEVGDARAVLIAGEGRSFCAGADAEAIDLGSEDEQVEESLKLNAMLSTIVSCPAPVIVATHGHALGVGCAIVCCADIAIASEDATFGFPEVRLGMIPAIVSRFAVARMGRAAERYLITGECFDATTALQLGLVHEVVDDLDLGIAKVVREVSEAAPGATRQVKQLLRDDPPPEEQARRMARSRRGREAGEGIRALRQRTRPPWTPSG